jgi:adenylate cyclase
MNQDRTNRKLAAIFSADVVGYSRLMESDETWTIKSLEENKKLMSLLIEEHNGRVIDSPGDNLLAEFNSVINAVECAVKVQEHLNSKNSKLMEDNRMNFRIGVNLGDVVEEDDRIYGNGVNIAARLEGLAEPGGICISGTAYDHVISKLNLEYEYLGEHSVKNIDVPVRVYRVVIDSEAARKVVGEKRFLGRIEVAKFITWIVATFVLTSIIVGAIIWNLRKPEPTAQLQIMRFQIELPEGQQFANASGIWKATDGELFYRSPDAIMAVSVETEPNLNPGRPERFFPNEYVGPYDISPDGKRCLMLKSAETSESNAEGQLRTINVVLNWFEELKEKVPMD